MKKSTKKYLIHLYWIIPLKILIILFLFLFLTNKEKIMCGDGICDTIETEFCSLDCKQECLNNTEVIATKGTEIEECSRGWQEAYYDILLQKNISTDYLRETEDIDYSHQIIQSLARQLKRESAKETAKIIAKWTKENIIYDESNNYFNCYNVKSSEIIERGYGLCSTQSKVNLALLRANGIPSRIITGCFTYSDSCRILQTIFRRLIPTIFPIESDESGYVSTRGGLHTFIEVLLPEYEDWTIIESTQGLLYEDTCVNYKKYYISEQDITPDSSEVCGLSPTNDYVSQCKEWI